MLRPFMPGILRAASLTLLATAGALGGASPANACSSDAYIGEICYTAANFCPKDYALADGHLLPVSLYQPAYSLFGNTFGGVQNTTFGVPDLRGRSPVGTGSGAGLLSIALGQQTGQQQVSLAVTNVPPHTHTASFNGSPGSTSSPVTLTISGNVPATNVPVSGSAQIGSTTGTATSTLSAGALLTNASTGATIYTTDGTANTTVGGSQTLSGTAIAALSGTANGNVTVNVPAPAGTVTVNPNTGGGSPVPTQSPVLGLTACVAVMGVYPSHP